MDGRVAAGPEVGDGVRLVDGKGLGGGGVARRGEERMRAIIPYN